MFPVTTSLSLPSKGLLCALALLAGSFRIFGQEEGEKLEAAPEEPASSRVAIDSLPSEFEEWRDRAGFSWQLTRQGALKTGNLPYLQSGMAIFMGGGSFTAQSGDRLDGGAPNEEGARIELRGKIGDIAVTRDVLFDAGRAGVRILDTFTNEGKTQVASRVDYKSSYQYSWQDLHGTEGRILSPKPGAGMGGRDFGVVVKFGPSEGRHDTLFLTSSERDAKRPDIVFSSNLRELTLTYNIEIPPGGSAALLHWVAQRNLQSPSDAEEALRPFYQRRRLIDPVVDVKTIPLVMNFDEPSFPEAGVQPFNLEALASLNSLLEDLTIDRRNEDLLWISPENQLAGEVNRDAQLTVQTAFGERKTGIAQVAAILGGGGLGRQPRIFLRDGRVWSGSFSAEKLTFKIAEGWDVEELTPEKLPLLLMRVDEADGRPPEHTGMFVAARSGDVLAVRSDGAAAGFEVLSPWGGDTVPLSELESLRYTRGAAPKFRLRRGDGSRLTVFLGGGIKLERAAGESVTLGPEQIVGAWKADASGLPLGDEVEDEWFDFEDIGGDRASLPPFAVLLKGNNLLNGKLAMESLHLVSGSAVTALNPAEFQAVRRSFDSGADAAPSFEIELRGGEVLSGRLRERVVLIESNGRVWQVPMQHFVAYRGSRE